MTIDQPPLAAEIDRLREALKVETERADKRHAAIAEGVFATVRDAAATWDTALDELIWGDYNVNGPEHQKVSAEHLANTCVQFPQWASELKPFAERWNQDDDPITPEMLAAVQVDEEEVKRGSRRAMQILRYYDRLHTAEKERDTLRTALRESVLLQSHYAALLNQYDGGNRKGFANADEWIERLATLAKPQYGPL